MTHWYDGLGVGSLVDMFTGAASSTSAAASSAAGRVAGSDNAQTAGKLTGLAPYMSLLGMTPTAPTEDRMIKPSEAADLAAGKMPATAGSSFAGARAVLNGGGTSYNTDVVDNRDKNGFEKVTNPDGSHGGYKLPSYQHWDAVDGSRSGGNRQSDIDARDEAVKVAAPEIYQPDLSKIEHHTVGQEAIPTDELVKGSGKYKNVSGHGTFVDTAWGTHLDAPEWGAKTTVGPDGKGNTSFLSGGGQAGGEFKAGYRGVSMSDDKRYTADAEGGVVISGGASGQYGLDTKNGAFATAGVGGKIGAYAQGNANAKTESVKVGGVDYDAGIGAHGEVFAGAKAGAGGTIGIGPDFVGAKGNIGAFIGAEAAGDIHGNLGPLAGKVGASGMVGAGIGADGDISYKDGKFHVGGKMFAALGYGGSLSGDVTVDVGAIGKTLYNGASTGLDYAGKGLSAAGNAALDVGKAGLGYASQGLSAAGDAASSLYNGAANLFSW
ncbi:MAG: hypothetical protein K8W52_40965 [Deltaproteobacteria bacterium]|nr:hypothetical protein [Deltaproteobacteria bacterium]